MNQSFWDRFFDFIEKYLPGLLASFGVGYSLGERKAQGLSNKVDNLELELKEEQNLEAVEKANAGKSDADIVRDAIGGGSTKP